MRSGRIRLSHLERCVVAGIWRRLRSVALVPLACVGGHIGEFVFRKLVPEQSEKRSILKNRNNCDGLKRLRMMFYDGAGRGTTSGGRFRLQNGGRTPIQTFVFSIRVLGSRCLPKVGINQSVFKCAISELLSTQLMITVLHGNHRS